MACDHKALFQKRLYVFNYSNKTTNRNKHCLNRTDHSWIMVSVLLYFSADIILLFALKETRC